jgi:glutamate-1-semialdehyde 2,1-aminomutase
MNKGAKIFKIKSKLILGGNMVLSKNPKMILPGYWPAYYKKSKGTHVWTLDNKKHLDMMCYVGQSTLGYSNDHIDSEVIKKIRLGNMTSLNSYEEIQLAEILFKSHKWANIAKFARSGGEANAMAIRIARAATGRDHVAICGYHGWHDWYLSVNLKNKKNLDEHLLPGLKPLGVPKVLKNTTHAFRYGNIDELCKITKKYNLAAIKMEVGRNDLPNEEFLNQVRDIATKKKIVLIFDECTSGFRRNEGGLHLQTKVNPDIAMFGKAMGNGYAITAVIGRSKIMSSAKSSFISSTFWTERIGFVAAIATLKYMKKYKTWNKLILAGSYINKKWKKLSSKYDLPITISGIDSITQFNFNLSRNEEYKTFITQEMLKKNILATNLVFTNIFHTKKIIDQYAHELDKIFNKIKVIEDSKKKIKFLDGKVRESTFARLTD